MDARMITAPKSAMPTLHKYRRSEITQHIVPQNGTASNATYQEAFRVTVLHHTKLHCAQQEIVLPIFEMHSTHAQVVLYEVKTDQVSY